VSQPLAPDDDPREKITRLEAQIEELTDTLERCRRLIAAAKVLILLGGVWMVALASGIIKSVPLSLVGATTAILGGIVVFGSNASTARQLTAAIRVAEEMRAKLIGDIELRVVSEEQYRHQHTQAGK
jgi:hypothetical protein